MQYTQQQRLAPEVADESALYSPIDLSACANHNYMNNKYLEMFSCTCPIWSYLIGFSVVPGPSIVRDNAVGPLDVGLNAVEL